MIPQPLAIVAALPREVAGLVRGVAPDRAWLASGVHLYRVRNAVIVTAGMGAERAALAVEAVFSACTPELLVSTGLAGSCDARARPGEALEADVVVDARTGERFRTASAESHAVLLASIPGIASVAEKTRLAATYGAALVDMEAATVARLAAARGLPFRVIKGVSDAHDFELAELHLFGDDRGQFRTAAFALHTALRPHRWKDAIELGRNSTRALALMQAKLKALFL